MKIRLTTGMATNEGRKAWSPGDLLVVGKDITEDEAMRLLEAQSAEPVAVKRSSSDESESRAADRQAQ